MADTIEATDALIELAEAIHKSTCTMNHTDRCGWYYQSVNWGDDYPQYFLGKAQRMLKETGLPSESIIKVLKALKG